MRLGPRQPAVRILGGDHFALFAPISGDIDKASCYAALRSRKDSQVEVTPAAVGIWTCLSTWDNKIAALKVNNVDMIAERSA